MPGGTVVINPAMVKRQISFKTKTFIRNILVVALTQEKVKDISFKVNVTHR